MEADDAFEAVIGKERTVSHHGRCVRLDADAEQHDRIDIGMFGHELQDLRDGVAGFAAGHVDRIVLAPARRQLLVDRRHEVIGQGGGIETGVGHGVDCCDPPTADRRDDNDTIAVGERLRSERRRRLECLFDIPRADEPGLAAHAVEHGVVACEGTGMGGRRTGTGS